jgi:hypothetical protein
MTKNFNTTLTLEQIINSYKNNNFPNSYCLLLYGRSVNLLITEFSQIMTQENNKGMEVET